MSTYKPPVGAANAAKRAIKWIEEGRAGSGFTSAGRTRASQLSSRENLTLETVKRMYSFFSRHEVDKKGKDFDNLSKPSPGRVAWDAWGGDVGYTWSKRIVESMSEKSIVSNMSATFVEIIKTDKQADGNLMVYGKATDDAIDSDQQICDPEWLKSAMPEWFKWGNIREQHSNIAAGKAVEYESKEDGHYITAHVVDSNSVKKVESGVLKGFSIGIRAPRVVRDNKAAGGRIVDGEIVEVSLVDRPANPNCTLSLAKAIDGSLTQVEELVEKKLEKGSVMDMIMGEKSSPEESTAEKAAPVVAEESSPEESMAAKADDAEMCKDCGKAMDECKCAEGGYVATEKADVPTEESSQAVGEESSQELGEESSRPGGVAGVAGKSDETKIHKMAKRLKTIEKQLAILVDAHTEAIAKAANTEDIAKSVTEVTERLSVVEKAASQGPARTRVTQPMSAQPNVNMIKSAEYREKALRASDPAMVTGYLLLADELEKSI